mgnify:CR=1 FL=1
MVPLDMAFKTIYIQEDTNETYTKLGHLKLLMRRLVDEVFLEIPLNQGKRLDIYTCFCRKCSIYQGLFTQSVFWDISNLVNCVGKLLIV